MKLGELGGGAAEAGPRLTEGTFQGARLQPRQHLPGLHLGTDVNEQFEERTVDPETKLRKGSGLYVARGAHRGRQVAALHGQCRRNNGLDRLWAEALVPGIADDPGYRQHNDQAENLPQSTHRYPSSVALKCLTAPLGTRCDVV